METIYMPDRVFQVWSYTVGMGRLLLRSTKSATFGTRVDVLFQNVKLIKLPMLLDGLTVRAPANDERQEIEDDAAVLSSEGTRIFIVEGSGYRGYVIAGVVATQEDQGEYDDTSPLMRNP